MTYVLKIKKFEESDINRDCPFGLDEDYDFDMYANTLAEDIENINGVSSVTRDNDLITIDASIKERDLKEAMKPFFKRDLCFIRYVSLKKE
ncbi:MAG: hypothetical protein L3J04_04975 [Robiginitomaculum sp.]|nr:hypothetical protein [Robiginitomaculum sp.]